MWVVEKIPSRRKLWHGSSDVVLHAWRVLLSQSLYSRNASLADEEALVRAARMCRSCFYAFEKLEKLKSQLEQNLNKALDKMPLVINDSSQSTPDGRARRRIVTGELRTGSSM